VESSSTLRRVLGVLGQSARLTFPEEPHPPGYATVIMKHSKRSRKATTLVLFSLLCGVVWSQTLGSKPAPTATAPETPKDTLGRDNPRGTVVGFLTAIKKSNAEVAALYLNTPLRGADAAVLARQLAEVLDRRLPARLNQVSDDPEGSIPDPLKPDQDLVGTITTANGELNVTLERVDRGKAGKVWLFSRETLASIPDVFGEINTPPIEKYLPAFMVNNRIADIPLFEWLALFVGLPLLYLGTGWLNRALAWIIGPVRRRAGRDPHLKNPNILRGPARLLIVALVMRLSLAYVSLPLLARQFWSTTALLIAVAACTWWLLLLNGWVERYVLERGYASSGSGSVLRLFRRLLDGVFLFAGFLFILHHFGINLTAALAGLGVGGIAVALAAQKTLENIIAGVSLIADEAVRVGDSVTVGDVQGTVEEVGLRSTRIRTLDRTLVILPNGQIANMKVETVSARDKFWFHPVLPLRYDTTPEQLDAVLATIREFLRTQSNLEPTSVRVRFFRLGAFSLDIDVFAYVNARDWSDFLRVQEQLLVGIMDILRRNGTGFALPSQTLYLRPDGSETQAKLLGDRSQEAVA